MGDCEFLKGCIFFNDKMKDMPGASTLYKMKYCKKDCSECARYILAKRLGREKVPTDLYPNQKSIAEEIIRKS